MTDLRNENHITPDYFDHAEYEEFVKHQEIGTLYFIIKDCKQAISANPNGRNNGNYADEILYCSAEIAKRQLGER
tara:strand:- start:58 stop:282 length:225 start_codon:yes stop_codon:yes gene_type:complete